MDENDGSRVNPISFSISRVNRLRQAADQAGRIRAFDTDRSLTMRPLNATNTANALLEAFDTLRLKSGFSLWAYSHRNPLGGSGEIRAVGVAPL